MGFIGSVGSALAMGSNYDAQKRQLRAQANLAEASGRTQKKQAEAQAANIARAAQLNAGLAGQQMRSARKQQSAEQGAARAAASGTGFMVNEGTGGTREEQVRQAWDAQIAHMAQSNSISQINAVQQAMDARREGEIAEINAKIEATGLRGQADAYNALGQATRNAAWLSGLTGLASGAYGAYEGWNNQDGTRLQKAGAAAQGFLGWGDMGWDVSSSMSPLLAGKQVNMANSADRLLALLMGDTSQNKKGSAGGRYVPTYNRQLMDAQGYVGFGRS